ncbi:MAG: hypothetical protein ACFFC7_29945, partial [Candidatus Hermodarchaeota archaeon]
ESRPSSLQQKFAVYGYIFYGSVPTDFDYCFTLTHGCEQLETTGITEHTDPTHSLMLDLFLDGHTNYDANQYVGGFAFINAIDVRLYVYYEYHDVNGQYWYNIYWKKSPQTYGTICSLENQHFGGDANNEPVWSNLAGHKTILQVADMVDTVLDFAVDYADNADVSMIPGVGWVLDAGLYCYQKWYDNTQYPGDLHYGKSISGNYFYFDWNEDLTIQNQNRKWPNRQNKFLTLEMLTEPQSWVDYRQKYRIEVNIDIDVCTFGGAFQYPFIPVSFDNAYYFSIQDYVDTTYVITDVFYIENDLSYSTYLSKVNNPVPPGGGGGGCPNLQVWNGEAFDDYGVMPCHNEEDIDEALMTDIITPAIINGNKMKIRLNEIGAGWDYTESLIDQVKLEFIDENYVSTYFKLVKADHSDMCGNQKSLVLYNDEIRLQIIKGEYVDLYFKVPDGLDVEDFENGHFIFHFDGHNQFKQ